MPCCAGQASRLGGGKSPCTSQLCIMDLECRPAQHHHTASALRCRLSSDPAEAAPPPHTHSPETVTSSQCFLLIRAYSLAMASVVLQTLGLYLFQVSTLVRLPWWVCMQTPPPEARKAGTLQSPTLPESCAQAKCDCTCEAAVVGVHAAPARLAGLAGLGGQVVQQAPLVAGRVVDDVCQPPARPQPMRLHIPATWAILR